MIEVIDQHGLKARNLRKFSKRVDEFYAAVIEGREYSLDVTKKYQKRFTRYRESLFRFLDEDGIPWNNNMAERAIGLLWCREASPAHFSSAVRFTTWSCLVLHKPVDSKGSRSCNFSCRKRSTLTVSSLRSGSRYQGPLVASPAREKDGDHREKW